MSSPLSNFEICVGILTDHKQNPLCGDRVRQLGAGEVWTTECKPPIPGQHVSVSMVGKGYLAICEVAVFARLGEWLYTGWLNQMKGNSIFLSTMSFAAIMEVTKPRRRCREQRRLKNEFKFEVRISRYSKTINFVYPCQNKHETESGTSINLT